MIDDLKEHLPAASTGALLGMLIPGLISLNIFATRADMAELEVKMAQTYIRKDDVERRLDKLEHLLEKLSDRLERKSSHGF